MSQEELVEKLAKVGINGEWIDSDEYGFSRLFQYDGSDFGKTVFLTKEEAEQKLKGNGG